MEVTYQNLFPLRMCTHLVMAEGTQARKLQTDKSLRELRGKGSAAKSCSPVAKSRLLD